MSRRHCSLSWCPAHYASARGSLRGVRIEPGSGADAAALPALAVSRTRLARGLAADLRRRGPRLGRLARDRRRGSRRHGCSSCCTTSRRRTRRRSTRSSSRRPGSTTRSGCGCRPSTASARLAVRARRLRRRPAVGALPRRHGRCRRDARRARRLRRRASRAAMPHRRAVAGSGRSPASYCLARLCRQPEGRQPGLRRRR